MGNCYHNRKDIKALAFDQTEFLQLNQQFQYYCELSSETRDIKQLNQKSFEDIFPENPLFGIKLFKFLEFYSGSSGFIKKQPLFEFCMYQTLKLVELLVKDSQTNVPTFQNFERFELMSLISLQNLKYLKSREDLAHLQLTYLDTLGIIKDLLKIYQHGQGNLPTNERYLRSLIDTIYKNEAGSISWVHLVEFVRKQMPGVKHFIKKYFQAKFMGSQFQVLINIQQNILPIVNSPSYFITDELNFQMMLSTSTILNECNQLTLVYSNIAHQGGFNQMIQSIKECKLPTLMFFQHQEEYDQKIKQQTFGALANLKWYDSKQYFGTKKDCIFTLNPYFKIYKAKRQEENFCYLDSNRGFGFGGTRNGEGCRIWIDKNLDQSYCTSNDNTYENGPLVLPYVKKLNLSEIEVWAINQPSDELKEIHEVNVDLKDPLLDKPEEIQYLESKADFYWTQQEKQEEPKNAGFYWENNDII